MSNPCQYPVNIGSDMTVRALRTGSDTTLVSFPASLDGPLERICGACGDPVSFTDITVAPVEVPALLITTVVWA